MRTCGVIRRRIRRSSPPAAASLAAIEPGDPLVGVLWAARTEHRRCAERHAQGLCACAAKHELAAETAARDQEPAPLDDLDAHRQQLASPQAVQAFVDGKRVARIRLQPNTQAKLRVPLESGKDTCVVMFRVDPTAVPAEVLPDSKDRRELGAHFNAFVYKPAS